MTNIKRLEDEVREILLKVPETRNSNEVLYAEYLERHGVDCTSVQWFFKAFPRFGVCAFESVTRVRRKIVEKTPELGASGTVKQARKELEYDMWDYAKERGELRG